MKFASAMLLLTSASSLLAADYTVDSRALKVVVEGASASAWKALKPVVELQLSLVDDAAVTPPLADDLAFFLHKEYFKLGYAQADVTWKLAEGAAVLTASEGELATIGSVEVLGTDAATQDEMRQYLLRPTKERMEDLPKNPPLVEGEISAGVGFVERLIQSRGYLSCKAGEPEYIRVAGRPVDIKIKLEPGPLSLFGEVSVVGKLATHAESTEQLLQSLPGQPFSEVRVEELRTKMLGDCKAAGHFKAEVIANATPSPAGGKVKVEVVVRPGPVFSIAQVNAAKELSGGAARIIGAGFRHATGRDWNPVELANMQRRAMDSGVFSGIEILPVNIKEEAATLDLELKGTESPKRTLGLYGGYETYRGPSLGLEWQNVNIANTGDTFRMRLGYEGGGYEGSLRWIDPAVVNSNFTWDTELAAGSTSLYDYQHIFLKLRSGFSRQFSKELAASVYALTSLDALDGPLLLPFELGPDAYSQQALGGTVSWDQRDNPLSPRSGWMASLSLETGLADIRYLRSDFRVSYYQPITDKFRLAANFQTSVIDASEGVARLPIDSRVFNGGASTVRSFSERELGPKSLLAETPLGGTAMQVVNLEASYEIISNLELALFADAGSLSRGDEGFFAGPNDLRYAVGLGIRYMLPVGPLRIDYGYNPSRKSGEASGALHVTFGFAF